MTGIFEAYRTRPNTYDEMYAADGQTRPAYQQLRRQVDELTPADLRARADYLSHTYLDQGVTFDIGGEERPFPVDIIPRLIDNTAWSHVEAGVAQRVRALEAFLAEYVHAGVQGRIVGLWTSGPPWALTIVARFDDHADAADGTRLYENVAVLVLGVKHSAW